MLADQFVDLLQRAADSSTPACQQVPHHHESDSDARQALHQVHDSQYVAEQPERRGLATQSDGAEGKDILNHVGGHQDQQQCLPVAQRSTIEASLPQPANEGPVDQDECQVCCDVDGQEDSANTNGAREVGPPSGA